MDRHPIESLMGTTMESIKDMVDVNTVIGDPVRTEDGSTIIPISRVSFGFVAGGGEYSMDSGKKDPSGASGANASNTTSASSQESLPFAGGSGAGVSVQPMGFLVVGNGQVKLLSANYITPVDRVMELLPQVIGDLKQVLGDDGESIGKRKHDHSKTSIDSDAYQSSPYQGSNANFDPPPYGG